ncbi:LamG-like jellyroll fold domain-containing protein [Negadavirga shengliensis]|uniref:LamG-like jellyroll fold domain-containing protein n=1 Tax=Negadavirga shengliensis TaxID=1389218 RepID=A0ABV9SX12_9BACT
MKKLSIILFIGLIWMAFGCAEGYIDDIAFVEPGPDEAAPEVTINYPSEGTLIRVTEDVTSMEVDLEVRDDIEIQSIVVELNGEEIARFEDFPDYRRALKKFEYDNVTNGQHTLTVTATDLSGKTTSETVNFEKVEPYRPVYDNEVFYVPFDGDFMELVRIQNPEVSGSPGFTNGVVGRAYAGANNAYLTYNTNGLRNQEFSAVFWYRVNATPDRAGLLVMGPPDTNNPNAMNNRSKGFRLFRESAGPMQRVKLNVGNGSGDNWFDGGEAADINPAAGEWAHIAFTISGSSCAVYINGEVVSQGAFSGIDWEGCDILTVGSGAPRFTEWGHLSTSSLMDELRIFDRALSQDEIQSIMAAERN